MAYVSTIRLKSGYKYIIWLSVTQNIEKDLDTLDQSQRDCLLPFEKESDIYTHYSQRNCIIECKLIQASKECGCVSWEFTAFASHWNASICGSIGQSCFNNHISNGSCQEECPIPCTTNAYTFSLAIEKIQPKTECYKIFEQENPREMPRWFYLLRPKILSPHDFLNSLSIANFYEYPCATVMEMTTILDIKPATDRVTTIIQRPRRTFADQLAAFGIVLKPLKGLQHQNIVNLLLQEDWLAFSQA
jgi:hypothetical protein